MEYSNTVITIQENSWKTKREFRNRESQEKLFPQKFYILKLEVKPDFVSFLEEKEEERRTIEEEKRGEENNIQRMAEEIFEPDPETTVKEDTIADTNNNQARGDNTQPSSSNPEQNRKRKPSESE